MKTEMQMMTSSLEHLFMNEDNNAGVYINEYDFDEDFI